MSLDKLTRDLIAIDSVTGNEDKILKFIEGYLIDEGYSNNIELHEGGLVVGNIIKHSVVALIGHVDTVPISNEQESIESSEIIYGRGAVDMKSGLAPTQIVETKPDGRHEQSPFVKGGEDSLAGDAGLEGNGIPKNGIPKK